MLSSLSRRSAVLPALRWSATRSRVTIVANSYHPSAVVQQVVAGRSLRNCAQNVHRRRAFSSSVDTTADGPSATAPEPIHPPPSTTEEPGSATNEETTMFALPDSAAEATDNAAEPTAPPDDVASETVAASETAAAEAPTETSADAAAAAASDTAEAEVKTSGLARVPVLDTDLIKELRDQTGAPIVDCKKALDKTGNDIAKAKDWLREHGAKKAAEKTAGRATSEGLVGLQISEDGRSAALVKVASETDFASHSPEFVGLVTGVADATLVASDITGLLEKEKVLGAQTEDGRSVQTLLDDAIVAIRENLSVTTAVRVESKEGFFVGYVHNKVDGKMAGTSAAIVELVPMNPAISEGEIQDIGKKLAMHIVAARPRYMTREDVPEEKVEREKKFLYTEVAYSGKPKNMIEKIAQGKLPEDFIDKIVNGKLRKWYGEIVLLEQKHMIEYGFPQVGRFLQQKGLALRGYEMLTVAKF